jgi:DNA-directed RNA polymerase alpha subunit
LEQYDYVPIQPYWFYSKKDQDHTTWIPFSLIDVQKLEQAYAHSKIKINHFQIISKYNDRKNRNSF